MGCRNIQTERGLKNRLIEHYNSVKAYIREKREAGTEDKTQERATLLARLKERGQAIAERTRAVYQSRDRVQEMEIER